MTEATLDKWKARAAAAQANRGAMPTVSAFVDEIRKDFPNARVTYASEAGSTVGAPGEDGVQPALTRRADPATSKAAAVRAGQFKGKHAATIFGWIWDHSDGQTYREIAIGTGLEPVAVARRMKELQERAGVYADGERDGMQVWKVLR